MKIKLVQTCSSCPQQYDAYDKETGKQVGYLRLRHGRFTVECPDVAGIPVLCTYPKGDGIFEEDEEKKYLKMAKKAIKLYYKGIAGSVANNPVS